MKNIDLIRQVSLFKNLDDADLQKLAAIATEQSFSAGSQIFAEKSTGASFYIIRYGSVRLIKQGEKEDKTVTFMGPGQHFGEMALIDDEPRSATVEAVENTETICIKRDDLENLLAQDSKLGFAVYIRFAKYLCLRLRATNDEVRLLRERSKISKIGRAHV
jgi:CRP-like cAMP-binding protein